MGALYFTLKLVKGEGNMLYPMTAFLIGDSEF